MYMYTMYVHLYFSGADDDLDNNGDVSMDDEDKEWKELQEAVKKDKEKDTNVMSHPVHAPFFPAVRTHPPIFNTLCMYSTCTNTRYM